MSNDKILVGESKPANEVVVNRIEDLPKPTDTGDGLGIAYRFEDNKQYYFSKDIYLSYPIVPKNNTITGSREVKVIYIGSGAFIRNNATTPIGITNIVYITLVGTGSNQLFDVTESDADAGISVEYCFLVNFNMGNLENLDYSFMRNVTIQEQKSKLFVNNDLVFFHASFFNPKAYIGEELLEVGQNILSIDINSSKFIPISGDSAFNINSSLIGRINIVNSELVDIYGGTDFKSGSLDQTDHRVQTKTVAGIPDSQTISSMYMEHNDISTTITAKGEDGSFTAITDAGGGQVTVTSVGHGLSNGEIVWIIDSGYTGKYTISNVTTDTFEITVTYTGTATGEWETNWVKIVGTTYPGENERAEMTDDNEITFANLEQSNVSIIATIGAENSTVAAAKNWEFAVMKNNERIKGGHSEVQMTSIISTISIVATSAVIGGDIFELYMRNMSDSSTQGKVLNFSIVIK